MQPVLTTNGRCGINEGVVSKIASYQALIAAPIPPWLINPLVDTISAVEYG
jgi:hypothetical protein